MDLKRLEEEKAELQRELNSFEGLLAERDNKVFTAEEINRFDAVKLNLDLKQNEIETYRRLNAVKSEKVTERSQPAYAPKIRETDCNEAFRAWALRQAGAENMITRSMYESAERVGLNLNQNSLVIRDQSTTGNVGGYTIDGLPVGSLVNKLKHYGPMRQACKVISTNSGATLSYPVLDDTSNAAAIVDQNTTINNTSLSFATKTLSSFKYASSVFKVSVELMQDSAFDFSSLVSDALATRIGRKQNTDFTTGAGTTEPYGVVTDSVLGATAGDDLTFSFADLQNLYHSLDIAYRNNASWMMNDSVFAYIKTLLDGNDRPLWQSDYRNADVPMLFGKPIWINNDMTGTTNNVPAASAKHVLFGDFSNYIIRDVGGVEIRVLNELYAQYGSVGFVAWSRSDGRLVNTSAVKHLIQAAS
jgi:HK97 family phage major capsid protein